MNHEWNKKTGTLHSDGWLQRKSFCFWFQPSAGWQYPNNSNKVIAIFPSEKLIGTRCFEHEVTLQNIRSQMSGNLAAAADRVLAPVLLPDICHIYIYKKQKPAAVTWGGMAKRCLIYRLMADCWEFPLSWLPYLHPWLWMFGAERIWDGLPSLWLRLSSHSFNWMIATSNFELPPPHNCGSLKVQHFGVSLP